MGGGNAAGLGSGSVSPGGQAVGQGTGIANVGPGKYLHFLLYKSIHRTNLLTVISVRWLIKFNFYIFLGGFGIGLGIGAAIATPLGNFAIGQGESTAIGK